MKAKALVLPLMLVSAAASAQFDFGGPGPSGGASGSWTDFKFNPKTKVNLNFHNAGIDPVIEFYEKASGITIVKDPNLKDTITLTSAKPVPVKDAMQIFVTELGLKGYDVSKEGTLLVIKSRQQRGPGGGAGAFPGAGTFDPSMFQGNGGGDNTELKVYPIQFANASQVARVLNDVFSGTGPSSQQAGGGFGGGRFGRGAGGPGGQNNPMQNFFRMMSGNTNTQAVKASADDYSNAVIVNASPKDQIQVASLIKSLDKQTDEPQQTQVFHLLYASATDLAPTVSTILVQNVPRGKGGLTATNIPPQQQFQQALRFGGSQTSFGQVTADTRTNSLVVVATPENLLLVGKVIQQLDVASTVLDTTFVFPLSNAKATDVATLFQQAFGTRQGMTGSTIRPTTTSTTNNTNTTNRNNTSGAGARPGGLGGNNIGGGQAIAMTQGRAPDPNYLPIALEDPSATSGPLETNVDVTQGFGGFFGGGQRPGGAGGTSTQSQAYRTPSGEIVNVRDLTNQVTVIPDPNTNSLIVVAPPDDATVLRNVLDQLDKIPQQVMIETVVAEASLDAQNKLGVEWKYAGGKSGTAGTNFGLQSANPALQGFSYTLTNGNYGLFLNALETDTKFKVLSTPRIFTTNNQQASINISQSLPYVLSSVTDATTGAISYNYAFENVGIILTVTPTITSNGYVTLVVTQTADELASYTNFNAPIVNQREADTTVQVKDGETVILGGIIQDQITSTVNKIPILGDLPLLGNLFRSTSKEDTKTELLIFLTPRVVRNVDDARKVTNDSRKELSPELQKNLSQATKAQTNTSGTTPGGGH